MNFQPSGMASEQFLVSWDNFQKNMNSGMNSLLENQDFVDVTLAIEGRYLKAHKMVLSVCSSYFRELFKTSPCKHPIFFMKDVSYTVMSDLLQFMYKGEVQVNEENFNMFIKTAESLQIRGLSKDGNASAESLQKMTKVMEAKVPLKTHEPSPSSKRFRLGDSIHDKIATNEHRMEESTATSSFNNELVSLKTEPYDDEEFSYCAESDTYKNVPDDPLAVRDSTRNEHDYTLDEVSQEDMKNEGEDCDMSGDSDNPEEIKETAKQTTSYLPEKSRHKYNIQYETFMEWCADKNVKIYTENTVLTYLSELSKKYKSSTLWSIYSMLKATLLERNDVDIGKYTKVTSFLKRKSVGYVPKKSKTFTEQEINQFLKQAPDEVFLMAKVVLIIGVAGACTSDELTNLTIDNIKDKGDCLIIHIPVTKNKPRTFTICNSDVENAVDNIAICRKYFNLRPKNMTSRRLFVKYHNGKCALQNVGHHVIGSIPCKIANYLNLPDSKDYTGHCFRRTSSTVYCCGLRRRTLIQ